MTFHLDSCQGCFGRVREGSGDRSMGRLLSWLHNQLELDVDVVLTRHWEGFLRHLLPLRPINSDRNHSHHSVFLGVWEKRTAPKENDHVLQEPGCEWEYSSGKKEKYI